MNELITACLSERDVQPIAQFPKELMTEGEIEISSWVLGFASKHGTPPTLKRLMDEFEHFIPFYFEADELEPEPPPLGDVFERQVNERLLDVCMMKTDEASRKMAETGKVPLDIFREVENLHTLATGVHRYSTFDRDLYFRRKSMDFPFRLINRFIGGLGKGDYMLIIGRLGTGKSTLAQWLAKDSWEKGRKILYVSAEMLAMDVFARIDAMVGSFNPLALRHEDGEKELSGILATVYSKASGADGEIVVPRTRLTTPAQITGFARNLGADLVIVDGVYLIQPSAGGYSSKWEKVAHVSNELKQAALDLEVPLVGVTQIKRGAGKSDEFDPEDIAYSDALGQDSDFIVAMKPGKVIKERVELQLIKNRYGPRGATVVHMDFDTMTITDESVEGAVDDGSEDWLIGSETKDKLDRKPEWGDEEEDGEFLTVGDETEEEDGLDEWEWPEEGDD